MKRLNRAANLDTPMHPLSPPTIYDLIDEYAREKYRRAPWEAGAQRGLLIRFAKNAGLNHVHEITKDHVAFFAGEELSEFFSGKAIHAIRQFLWYCRKGGYKCLPHTVCKKDNLQRIENDVKISKTPSWELKPIWATESEDRSISINAA